MTRSKYLSVLSARARKAEFCLIQERIFKLSNSWIHVPQRWKCKNVALKISRKFVFGRGSELRGRHERSYVERTKKIRVKGDCSSRDSGGTFPKSTLHRESPLFAGSRLWKIQTEDSLVRSWRHRNCSYKFFVRRTRSAKIFRNCERFLLINNYRRAWVKRFRARGRGNVNFAAKCLRRRPLRSLCYL